MGADMTSDPAQGQSDQIKELKALLATQQKEIEQLRLTLADQQKTLEKLAPATADSSDAKFVLPSTKKLGEVATTSAIIPSGPSPAAPLITSGAQAPPGSDIPAYLRLGDVSITPVGFMDMTEVSRSTNPGSGIGTNFGSIPYDHTQAAALTESRFSIQNSRIGARIDASVHDWNLIGYWESDFLGQLGNPPNGGLSVSSDPFVFRLRLYWADVRKNNWEFLAGQSWSLMTPNRKGISPLPGDIFYSQDIDVNYQVGLTWGRIPGFRFGYHFNDKAAFAVALENSEPYVGGGNGGSAIVAPAAVASAAGFLGSQVNNGSSVISAAALMPDIIAKVAFDPTSKLHFEVAGVAIANKIAYPASVPPFQANTKLGGGFSANLNVELAPGFRFLTNNFWSDGGGRYIFGQAPDFIIRADGSLSLVHSMSTVTGFEWTHKKNLLYGYYGGVYIPKNTALDTTGKLIGYGPISNDGQNRSIQEFTVGTNTTLAKNARWGALNLMFQYSYLVRNPWLFTTGPEDAHLSMGFVNFRYTLPGSAPAGTKR